MDDAAEFPAGCADTSFSLATNIFQHRYVSSVETNAGALSGSHPVFLIVSSQDLLTRHLWLD